MVWRPRTLPTGADGAGRTASNFYELPDNLEPASATAYLGVDPDRPHTRPEVIVNDQTIIHALSRVHLLMPHAGMVVKIDETLADALGALQRLISDFAPSTHPPQARHLAVRRARDYLHDHWNQPVTLGQLAAQARLSPYRLSRTFHDQLGMPPSAYQRQLRLEKAKHQLRNGQPPANVALDCGFYDQAHLNRVFKRHVGITPGRYAAA